MFLPLSFMPSSVAFALWLVLQIGALVAALWASLKLVGADRRPGRVAAAVGAMLLADNAVGWDLRTHNNNIVYLSLVMLALVTRRAWLSGLLFAMSWNLKIYSGAAILGVLLRREYRLAIAIVAASALLAIVVPIAVFGFEGYIKLLVGRYGQANFQPPPGKQALMAPDPFPLAAAALLNVPLGSTSALTLLWVARAVWVALVLTYLAIAARRPTDDGKARLADTCVLLLAPLPFSPWFAPYHAIVLVPAFMLLIALVAREMEPLWLRLMAGAALLGSQVLYYSLQRWEFRSAVYLMIFVMVVVVFGAFRRGGADATQLQTKAALSG
jgi:hypothetical protein